MTEMNGLHNVAGKKHNMHGWWSERSLPVKILMGIGIGIVGIGFFALCGWVLMLLWNWLMPVIFGLKTINYWQAWGLLILSSILFKRMGPGHSNVPSEKKRKQKLRSYMQEEESEKTSSTE